MAKEFETIKNYYKPIQPTVRIEDKGVVYTEVCANKELENFIYCFWQLKTPEPLGDSYTYRVVSDGCIDIFFDHDQPQESFVMGFCRKYTEFPIGKTFDYIGIRFLPSAFPFLFGVDAKTLSNRSQELKYVLPKLSGWITSEINVSVSFENVIEKLNKELTHTIKE